VKLTSTLAVSAFALAVGIASPVMAQQTSTTNSGPVTGASGDNSDTTTTNASLDLNVQDSGNTDNSVNDSGNLAVSDSGNDNSNNSVNDSGNLAVADSGNDNSTNDSYNDNSTNDSGNLTIADSGNTDNSVKDSGNLAISDSGNDNSVNQSYNALDSYNTDNSTYDSHDDNSSVVADQYLSASVTNEEDMWFDGEDSDYSSGDNSVYGSAFAAYAGILNQAWNTGINANAQAATNVAARGTVTFGN
jgi:hypothetical protein